MHAMIHEHCKPIIRSCFVIDGVMAFKPMIISRKAKTGGEGLLTRSVSSQL